MPDAAPAHPSGDSATAIAEPGHLPDALDSVLAATAAELASGVAEDADFADPAQILEQLPVAPPPGDEPLDLPEAPSGSAAAAPEVAAETGKAHGPQEPAGQGPGDEFADFADPSLILGEISAELEATSAPSTEAPPTVPANEPAADEAALPSAVEDAANTPADAEPTAPAPAEQTEPTAGPPASEPEGAIERLDEVLAAEAETVLQKTPETPRIAEPSPAPAPAAPAPAPVPAAAPASAPAPAPPAPVSAPAASPEPPPEPLARPPRPRPSLRPALAAVGARLLRPLARINDRLSPTVRQTIAWAAVITLFNAAWVWGYVLVRGPQAPPQTTGEGPHFYKPGEPIPDAHGTHAPAHADAPSGHGASHAEPKKDDGHAKPATKKKPDDGHGGGHGAPPKKKDAKSSASKNKKDAAKQAAHH